MAPLSGLCGRRHFYLRRQPAWDKLCSRPTAVFLKVNRLMGLGLWVEWQLCACNQLIKRRFLMKKIIYRKEKVSEQHQGKGEIPSLATPLPSRGTAAGRPRQGKVRRLSLLARPAQMRRFSPLSQPARARLGLNGQCAPITEAFQRGWTSVFRPAIQWDLVNLRD